MKIFYHIQNTVSGTDVIDFKNVKTVYGTLDDFDSLLVAAKEMGTIHRSYNYYVGL